jgi:hypothetical protein
VGVQLERFNVTKPEREEVLIVVNTIVYYGLKCLQCQDIVGIEFSRYGSTYANTSSFIRKVNTAGV